MTKTPITIITGFLGAGKTTFIRNIAKQSSGVKLAFIVNEFGEMGFDGSLLQDDDQDEIALIELANGCICCRVDDDFLPSIKKILSQDIPAEHIIIETSGLALPLPLVNALNHEGIKDKVELNAIITLVDAVSVRDGYFSPENFQDWQYQDQNTHVNQAVQDIFYDQLKAANIVILAKTDKVDPYDLAYITLSVKPHLAENVKILSSTHEGLDSKLLFDKYNHPNSSGQSDHKHHMHHQFHSLFTKTPFFQDLDEAFQYSNNILERKGILRMKGYVEIGENNEIYTLQGVGNRVNITLLEKKRDVKTGVIIIGHKNADFSEL